MPALGLARPFAALAIFATLLGRAIGPSAAGMGVGLYHVSRGLELAGDLTSQIVAMLATVVSMALLLELSRAKVSIVVKVGAVALGALALIVALVAAAIRVRGIFPGLLACGMGILAIAAARLALQAPFARVAGLVVGSVGVASLLRMSAIGIVELASSPPPNAVITASRVAATVAFVPEVAAIGLGIVWITMGARKATSVSVVFALGAALVATRVVLAADPESLGVVAVLVKRGAERLVTRPPPYVPHGVHVFVKCLAPLLALAVLFARGRVPALSAAIALALVVGGAPEMPVGALCLLVAGVALILGSLDTRGLWAALDRTSKAGPRAGDRPARAAQDEANGGAV